MPPSVAPDLDSEPALLGLHHTPYFRLDGAFRLRTASASLAASVNVSIQTWFTVVHFTIVPHPPPYHQLRPWQV